MGNTQSIVRNKYESRYFPKPVLRVFIHMLGPFFGNPVKPLLNYLEGNSYPRAYYHFRRDHRDPYDLFMHMIALVLQLGGNFMLLDSLDRLIFSRSTSDNVKTYSDTLSKLTATIWGITCLFTSPTPNTVKIVSCGAIMSAYRYRTSFASDWINVLMPCMCVVESIIFDVMIKGRFEIQPSKILPYLAIRLAMQTLYIKFQGILKDYKLPINVAVLGTMFYQSLISKYGHREYLVGAMYLPLIAALTDQRWMYMYSMAYTASMWQGVAHKTSKEAPTLPQLGNNYSDELAHTTFFPNLLLQSIHHSIVGGPPLSQIPPQ
jgi:hypothetical protein